MRKAKAKKLPRQHRIGIPKRFPMKAQDEVWSLDWTIANFVLPRLRYFRACEGNGNPPWTDMLDKMIAAFVLLAAGAWDVMTPTDQETIDDGLALFAKHFTSLWN